MYLEGIELETAYFEYEGTKGLTLGVFVSPLLGHSLTSEGKIVEHICDCSTHGALMILTVKPVPASTLRKVSLGSPLTCKTPNAIVGGLGVI